MGSSSPTSRGCSPGPLCTMSLGDLGADVIKVERPDGGDDTRAWGPPFVDEGSTYYLGLNRNKRSVTLDLKDPADVALARELCVRADVVVESFRPGTSDRLGLGYDEIARANPGVVYCSISAFGSGERAAALPGYDLLLQAMSGLMSVTGEPDGRPLKVGAALIDMICGLFATNGILAALRARDRDGRGQRVEVSLMDAALASLLNQASAHLNAGVGAGAHGQPPPVDRPVRDLRGRRRRLRGGRRQRRDLRPPVRGRRAPGAGRRRALRHQRGAHGAPRRAGRRARGRLRDGAGRRLGRRGWARRACRPGRSTTSRRPSPSRPSWASSPSTRPTACARCARRCASARRRRL